MPNNVYTEMNISGDPAAIKEFAEKHFNGNHFDLNSFVPMPEELEGTTAPCPTNQSLVAKYGFDNWYDWCNNNWGTKWNSYEGEADVLDDQIICSFQTAWNLPEPIFKAIGEMYPTLLVDVQCVEEGGFFSGKLTIIDGVVDDSGITGDHAQWKEYAEEMLGWMEDEEE